MRRREFITLLGGAAVVWPLRARAQPLPIVGFLNNRSVETSGHLIAAFNRGLSEGGFIEGRNVVVEYPAIPAGSGTCYRRWPQIWLSVG